MDFDMEGPTHVNIDWPVRDKIVEALKTNPTSKNIFDQAQTAILHSLLDEAWPRFKESEVCVEHQSHSDKIQNFIHLRRRLFVYIASTLKLLQFERLIVGARNEKG